jgi:PAS domain S-box-containing protein
MMLGMDERVAVIAAVLAGTTLVAAVVLRRAARGARGWPGGPYLALALLLLAAGEVAVLLAQVRGVLEVEPGPIDLLFLAPLVAFALAARSQSRASLPTHVIREMEADVVLILVSLAAALFLVIRPVGADDAASASAMVFAFGAAGLTSSFSGLALWSPTRAHTLLFLILAGLALGFGALGWGWVRGDLGLVPGVVVVPLAACPLLLAALVTATRGREVPGPIIRPGRLAQPILANVSVVGACVAIAVFATTAETRGIDDLQSTVIIATLSAAIVARIIADHVSSTTAHVQVSRALEEKAAALRDTDVALGRVREAVETLRDSEEHLRLVFEAAVDAIVELSEDGRIIRANDAFCRLVGLGPELVEGQPWSAVAATIDGPDHSFAELTETGQAQLLGREGQMIHLESRVSEVPTSPPRRLLLVRDVSAAKVAEQTIRSLFQFLQDRDEDRTRLLKRTNAAIESERNRIARDLHDGPVQGVSAASLSLEAALLMLRAGDADGALEVLAKIRQELADEADALRRLMSGLRPPVLEERGLMPAIRDSIGRFGEEQEAGAILEGSIEHPLPPELETLAFRVVQEALTNAAKHARAGVVTVRVASDPTQVQIEVTDDGVGFDPTRARDFLQAGRVGLASMRERVELANGTLTVRSAPDRGTTVTASLPVDPSASARELADREA